ncbi:peptidoglycan-binding domain-containing protein [Parafilimonas sp.]|uniref:peptidoglycan-binding domain-containing protein n=1 Tax=Parafilimonas sp. TaxID=1969739 RepID=UPI003F820219
MKRFFLLLLLTFFLYPAFAQDLTGIWRGNFYAGAPPFQQYYKYEVQIDQLNNNSIKGVTYSYRTTVFYGKATFEGIWFPKTESALIKELKLVELKMAGNSDACAMTCNLEYSKQDGKEILSGTFTSINVNSKTDCGSGTVYLERVQESDFHKEDFLLKKKPSVPSPEDRIGPRPTSKNTVVTSNTKKLQSALGVPADGVAGPKTMAALRKKLPGYDDEPDFSDTDAINKLINRIKGNNSSATTKTPSPVNDVSKANAKRLQTALGVPADGVAGPKTITALKNKLPDFKERLDVTNTNQVNDLINRIKKADAIAKNTMPVKPPAAKPDTIVKGPPPAKAPEVVPEKIKIPVPEVIKKRSNPLIRTIVTNQPDIKIDLYDNGDIDGDTITVYHNNEVIAWKKGLTDKPVTINVKADAGNTMHEFVMVADNLGSIPPNTALMIITTGGKRYQLFVSSDKQKNAKVVVEYQP